MKLFKNWFSSKEVEVPELSKIELKPEIEISAEVRRQLYDSAVAEVQLLRVEALIHSALVDMVYGPKVLEDTEKAFKKAKDANENNRAPLCLSQLRKEFPDAIIKRIHSHKDNPSTLKETLLHEGLYSFDLSNISAKDISKTLAVQYLSE